MSEMAEFWKAAARRREERGETACALLFRNEAYRLEEEEKGDPTRNRPTQTLSTGEGRLPEKEQ